MIKFTLGPYPELIGKAGIMKTRLLNNSGNKKQGSFRLAMFFLLALFTATSAFAQNKYALIVAIGDYPEETDWNDISSVNDIPLIEFWCNLTIHKGGKGISGNVSVYARVRVWFVG